MARQVTISYIGKINFTCQMCSGYGRDQYIAKPQLPKLVDWKALLLCKKCARREFGSKRAKEWKALHDLGRNV